MYVTHQFRPGHGSETANTAPPKVNATVKATAVSTEPPSPAKSTTTEPSSPKRPPAIPSSSSSHQQQSARSTPLAQQNTMVSNKLDSTQRYSNAQTPVDVLQKGLAQECAGNFAGPVDIESFLDKYVPKPPPTAGDRPDVGWGELAKSCSEKWMYGPFVRRFFLTPQVVHQHQHRV
ncbi:uncharacterized protein STEHIDRAFT_156427 [Stereum hirsutum FP-91666 SS1]|uniref:uncharacterized protein n=1 Tax=Stereum hirsutum (strain FP-91666) TaxID=721885 RepID=UPI000440E165|nr:uncharacterized protein STEHIDRAFT_156427 [Stereum hirsutum FP-91666 SS1]EIM87460.1 hypothetical protein STEHIDRAFT_156427 [Stereum hirsutum FP-91666 SS1]